MLTFSKITTIILKTPTIKSVTQSDIHLLQHCVPTDANLSSEQRLSNRAGSLKSVHRLFSARQAFQNPVKFILWKYLKAAANYLAMAESARPRKHCVWKSWSEEGTSTVVGSASVVGPAATWRAPTLGGRDDVEIFMAPWFHGRRTRVQNDCGWMFIIHDSPAQTRHLKHDIRVITRIPPIDGCRSFEIFWNRGRPIFSS